MSGMQVELIEGAHSAQAVSVENGCARSGVCGLLTRGATAAAFAMLTLTADAVPVAGQGTWEATLQARDFDGNGSIDGYYDTALNVTWMADWNASSSNHFDTSGGRETWHSAMARANAISMTGVFGVTGWRLPRMVDIGGDGCNFSNAGGTDCGYNVDTSNAELAHMWYVTLGNRAICGPGDQTCAVTQPGFGLTNTANFVHFQNYQYWYGTEYEPDTTDAWRFIVSDGPQGFADKSQGINVVLVHDGDVRTSLPVAVSAPVSGVGAVMAFLLAIAATIRQGVRT
jgi:hypothetical protein